MHPAPSVILFTVLSGMGFGCLAFLGLGLPAPAGWTAFLHWGLGYALAVGGLSASTFHLGNPQRALKAFSQWQTSWLSREAWTVGRDAAAARPGRAVGLARSGLAARLGHGRGGAVRRHRLHHLDDLCPAENRAAVA